VTHSHGPCAAANASGGRRSESPGLKKPGFDHLVASPGGDLPVVGADRDLPLDGCTHKSTYGQYFACIEHVLAQEDALLRRAMQEDQGQSRPPRHIRIRAQKHGALYHPASLEVGWPDGLNAHYALLVAISRPGREALRREAALLQRLQSGPGRDFLPRPLGLVEDGARTFLLVPWFTGFHEFHVAADGSWQLWDHDLGLRQIPLVQVGRIAEQTARILTLCLDTESGACIHPWSHAAGDLIVRMGRLPKGRGEDVEGGLCGDQVDVRLTTVRDFRPLIKTDTPLSALFAFFLDLALRSRLDRVDGVGEWVWLGREVLEAARQGFQEAADQRGADGSLHLLAQVLPAFSPGELLDGYEAILEYFSPAELALILPRLEEHCRELHGLLRTGEGGKSLAAHS